EGAEAWAEKWAELNDPRAGQPLLNRGVGQIAPPGSTFKMVTALAALEDGLNPAVTQTCPGALDIFDQSYGCWKTHGVVDLQRAIAESCNVYFYRAGLQVGIDAIVEMARAFGLGEPTGILGLPPGEESGGILPDRVWKQENLGEPWYPGETLMAAIGQGFHAYTPLQLASYVATIASGGVRYRPYIVQRVAGEDGEVLWEAAAQVVAQLPASESSIRLVQRGMEGATAPGGSGHWRFRDYPRERPDGSGVIAVAGKTGTAEVGSLDRRRESHGAFVAYAPADDPEIAVAVVIYHGGGGSLAAAPVARVIIDEYFGFPVLPEDSR
ncbi:MAG: penicillin-binding transpeptidase domain-containing protein, partial [Bacillota bacterium]